MGFYLLVLPKPCRLRSGNWGEEKTLERRSNALLQVRLWAELQANYRVVRLLTGQPPGRFNSCLTANSFGRTDYFDVIPFLNWGGR
jgi:hypothetical protein